jgi:hypothetical protein
MLIFTELSHKHGKEQEEGNIEFRNIAQFQKTNNNIYIFLNVCCIMQASTIVMRLFQVLFSKSYVLIY